MIKSIVKFFDKLEDKVRGRLSHKTIIYAFIGGTSTVLFWRGVWHLADDYGMSSWGSFLVGGGLLLITGLFVATFIGEQVILSGLKGEKKLADKTEDEVRKEANILFDLRREFDEIVDRLEKIENKLNK
jgi:hypothetical protein